MTGHPSTLSGTSALSLDRRQLLVGAGAAGLALGPWGSAARAAETPKRGGTLRLGMAGGSASDNIDPRTYSDAIHIAYANMLFNPFVDIDQQGEARGELLESWETKPGAAEWVFNVRKGVEFHSGKKLDADDIIYSLNLHRGESKSPAKALLLAITDIKKLSPTQIGISLSAGNIDLPYLLSDYHLWVVPNGFTDWSKPDGTGAYALESFEPGVRILVKNTGRYWKPNSAWFDSVELKYIPDQSARSQALLSGQIDAANRLDPKTVSFLQRSPKVNVVQTKGTGNRLAFAAHCDTDPFKSVDARMALKYGIDRQKIIDTVYKGFATVGSDTLIAPSNKYYVPNNPPHTYDPDKAKFLWKKAGGGAIELQVSEGAYPGATDSGVLFQEALKAAGIDMTVKRVSGDGYWDNVWLKVPFCAVLWFSRPSVDAQLSQTFLSKASWNDTNWRSPEFDKLIEQARVELDDSKRKEMYAQAQHLIADDGGMICYAIGDYLDGYSNKIKGAAPYPRYEMCDQKVAETCWFA